MCMCPSWQTADTPSLACLGKTGSRWQRRSWNEPLPPSNSAVAPRTCSRYEYRGSQRSQKRPSSPAFLRHCLLQAKFATCMLLCTECSATVFPIISYKLCVANSTGQIVDEAGQAVDLALWQQHFTHCSEKCPGNKGREFLARIDTTLIFSELDYAKKKIKPTPPGRWQDFKYTTGRVRSASQGSASNHSSSSPAAPPSASRQSLSVESLSCAFDLGQTHPVALGLAHVLRYIRSQLSSLTHIYGCFAYPRRMQEMLVCQFSRLCQAQNIVNEALRCDRRTWQDNLRRVPGRWVRSQHAICSLRLRGL